MAESLRFEEKTSGLAYITTEELASSRKDPAWEARYNVVDRVVCRECGAIVRTPLGGKRGHLWVRHRIKVGEYRASYPGARLRSFKSIAAYYGYNTQELMGRFKSKFVLPEELAECRKDPEWERRHNLTEHVVCRECGAKVRSALCGGTHHLSVHGLRMKEYRTRYPGAPWRTAAVADAQKRMARILRANPEYKKKLSAASRRWQKNNPEAVKRFQARYSAKPESKAKKRAYHRLYRARIRAIVRNAKQAGITAEHSRCPSGRPRKDDVRSAISTLRSNGLSWNQIARHLNRQNGTNLTTDAYRNLMRR